MQPVSKADNMVTRGGALSERHMLINREIKGRNSSLMICFKSKKPPCGHFTDS